MERLYPFGPAVANDMRADFGLLRALQVLVAAAAHDYRRSAKARADAAVTENGRVGESLSTARMTSLVENLAYGLADRCSQRKPAHGTAAHCWPKRAEGTGYLLVLFRVCAAGRQDHFRNNQE
ncbi:hypothetical protein P9273_28190 [Mesorhizobium sp. WSM4935]|uniref:hypothetical protein n=1 Tax=Mesorhizobium sp. WSM4935 TaxID=3038547 RepID=UPI0024151ABB|nr:hypothetical protein [Mesorhizobium sp. WSM4935]MDG4878963.1 hypothetical protein [Mesorhizobium sp. WSM4935]